MLDPKLGLVLMWGLMKRPKRGYTKSSTIYWSLANWYQFSYNYLFQFQFNYYLKIFISKILQPPPPPSPLENSMLNGGTLTAVHCYAPCPANTKHLYKIIQHWSNVFDVRQTLHKCYTNVLCLLGGCLLYQIIYTLCYVYTCDEKIMIFFKSWRLHSRLLHH